MHIIQVGIPMKTGPWVKPRNEFPPDLEKDKRLPGQTHAHYFLATLGTILKLSIGTVTVDGVNIR